MNRIETATPTAPTADRIVNSGIGPARLVMTSETTIALEAVGTNRDERAFVIYGRFVIGSLALALVDGAWTLLADSSSLRYDDDNQSEGLPEGNHSREIYVHNDRIETVREFIEFRVNNNNGIAALIETLRAEVPAYEAAVKIAHRANVANAAINEVTDVEASIAYYEHIVAMKRIELAERTETANEAIRLHEAAVIADENNAPDEWADMFTAGTVDENEAAQLNEAGREALALTDAARVGVVDLTGTLSGTTVDA